MKDVATKTKKRRRQLTENKPKWYRKACRLCDKRVTTRGRRRHLLNHAKAYERRIGEIQVEVKKVVTDLERVAEALASA